MQTTLTDLIVVLGILVFERFLAYNSPKAVWPFGGWGRVGERWEEGERRGQERRGGTQGREKRGKEEGEERIGERKGRKTP